tara:strand:+ start:1870 stop:2211 length:342 start_codon:yes stop_codon:yes gene_type:complete
MTATVPEISIHDDVTVGSFKLPEGYTMGTLGFSGTIDGIPVTANGTVEVFTPPRMLQSSLLTSSSKSWRRRSVTTLIGHHQTGPINLDPQLKPSLLALAAQLTVSLLVTAAYS